MDPIAAPPSFINAIDSSLSSSFVQLEIKTPTSGDGPINRLPNEMILQIMARLRKKSDSPYIEDDDYYYYRYDVKQLIRLRLVSTRWRAIVEDYCGRKKSLLVNWYRYIDLKNSVPLFVSLKNVDKIVNFFGMMPKLFPNIEQLKISWYSPQLDNAQFREFAVNIDSLNSLKQLEVDGQFVAALPYMSRTLSQLEHIRVDAFHDILTEDDLLEIVSHLGPDCARVHLGEGLNLYYNQIRQWHSIKPHLFANLTHLQILFQSTSEDCARVVRLLSKHATLLKLLNFCVWGYPSLKLTPAVIEDLGKLANLEELELNDVNMDISVLEQAADQHRLVSLSSVLTCKLYISCDRPTNADKFTRVLAVIFPNLVELEWYIDEAFSTSDRFLRKIEQHLGRFPNLRKHQIGFRD